MQVRYQCRYDADYFRVVIDRQYRQGPRLLRLPVQFGAIGIVAGLFWVTSIDTSTIIKVASFFAIVGVVMVLGVMATKQGLMMKFQGRPGFGSELAVTLSDAGVEAESDHSQTRSEWLAYPSAVRFADGILLKRPGSIRWLPDVAITMGTSAEATALVASKTLLRYVG